MPGESGERTRLLAGLEARRPARGPSPAHRLPAAGATLQLLELRRTGECVVSRLTRDQLLDSLAGHRLPARDLQALLRAAGSGHSRRPALLPRPSSRCFILDVEHITLLCFSDKCLILNSDVSAMHNFVSELKLQFETGSPHHKLSLGGTDPPIRLLHLRGGQQLDFEHLVLEQALEDVVRRFRNHLATIKPALELLLQQLEQNPETNGLRRLLAIKKSFAEFDQTVENVMKVIRNLAGDDGDMLSLYLSRPDRLAGEQEEVELLLGSYSADLEEIGTDIKIVIDMIEDTDQFISVHLDSVRNQIITMSLFIEFGGLLMGFGAVVSGIFGMNLDTHMDESPSAFWVVCICVIVMMCLFFVGFTRRYYQLRADTSEAQGSTLLKNFFTHVDDLEPLLFNKDNKKMEQGEFKAAVEEITGLKVTDKEAEFLQKMATPDRRGGRVAAGALGQ
jgi:hypothetical protein